MSPVIGQGIALSEKWPGIFVVAERGNDFETGAAKGGWAKMEREERGTWTPSRASLVMCEHAVYIHAYAFEYLRGRFMQHTCRSVYARSCSL